MDVTAKGANSRFWIDRERVAHATLCLVNLPCVVVSMSLVRSSEFCAAAQQLMEGVVILGIVSEKVIAKMGFREKDRETEGRSDYCIRILSRYRPGEVLDRVSLVSQLSDELHILFGEL